MSSKKNIEEAAEQLHNDNDVNMERIKDLMGPPPLESTPAEMAASDITPQPKAKIAKPNLMPYKYEPATSAPPLDTKSLEDQFADNLSIQDKSKVSIAVVDNSADAEDVDIANETQQDAAEVKDEPLTEEERTKPSGAEGAGLVSSEHVEEQPVPAPIDESGIDDVIDDIVAHETDEVLAAQDEKKAKEEAKLEKKAHKGKLKTALLALLKSKKTWVVLFVLLIVGLAVGLVVPVSRYLLLNTVGVRSAASLVVMDESTLQPLKNAEVTLAGKTVTTDATGAAVFNDIKMGKTELKLKRRAFAEVVRPHTVGWGSNPIGEVGMRASGTVYRFKLVEHFTNTPQEKIEVTSGEFSAQSNAEGKVELAIDEAGDADPQITIDSPGFRVEKFAQSDTNEKEVKLVPRLNHVFVSKRSGKFDLFKIDADGKNEALLLEATGKERDDLYTVAHPEKAIVAYVSTRDGQRNKDGFLLSSLYVIDVVSGERTRVVLSERVQVIGWYKNKLIYVSVTDGASQSNPNRQKLSSYDIETEEKSDIANTNNFNDILATSNTVFYAPSNTYNDPGIKVGLFRLDTDTGATIQLFDQEVWNIFRTDFDKLSLSVQDTWFEMKLSDTKPEKVAGPPAQLKSRDYITSPDNKRSLWIDQRDGKGVLLRINNSDQQEERVFDKAGLRYPLSWLSNSVVAFRVADGRESADYIMSLDGGETTKLIDVTNTGTVDHTGY